MVGETCGRLFLSSRRSWRPLSPRPKGAVIRRRSSQTYNQKPFDYRIESHEEKAGMVVYRLTYPSPIVSPVKQNNTIPAEYYVPKGIRADQARRPAVICLHILNGNYELERMCCTMLATHGVPAIMFKLPYYGERVCPAGKAMAANPQLFAGALTQGVEDVRRTVDLLACVRRSIRSGLE